MTREAPTNLRSLEARITNAARSRGTQFRRLQRAVANVVVGQMTPPGVVKGGTAMKLRAGEAGSRFTPDLDAARHRNVTTDDYLDDLRARLAEGWGGFVGTVERREPATPDGVPDEYVMQPFAVKLDYLGRHWLTVRFELGHDEIGSTETPEVAMAEDLVTLFDEIGLPEPQPITVLGVEHQVAQKLHACTSLNPRTGSNDRAHDLVDLQLLTEVEQLDFAALRSACERLFRARQSQPWPPTVVAHANWPALYSEAADGLGVLDDVEDAVEWANALVDRIASDG